MDFNKIKQLSTDKHINMTALAGIIGMSRGGLNTAISNKTLSIDKLEEIAKALNVPITDFFETTIPEQYKAELETLKSEIKAYIDQVDNLHIKYKLTIQNEQLVLEMYNYFVESLTGEERKLLSANNKYEKFTTYLVSCFGMNIWDEAGNEKMKNLNKRLLESTINVETTDPEKI